MFLSLAKSSADHLRSILALLSDPKNQIGKIRKVPGSGKNSTQPMEPLPLEKSRFMAPGPAPQRGPGENPSHGVGGLGVLCTGAVSFRKRKPGYWPGESETFQRDETRTS